MLLPVFLTQQISKANSYEFASAWKLIKSCRVLLLETNIPDSFLDLQAASLFVQAKIPGAVMNILAIDTSSTSGSIALARDQKIIFMSYLDVSRTHSERLLSQIDFGLKHCELPINILDMICIGNGPGSFTGIRIGLATAKGLCLSNQIPLHPFNTLELLAHNLWGTQRAILCLLDARMGEIYGALYDSDHKMIIPPCSSSPLEFLQRIDRPVIVVGDGLARYRNLLQNSGLDFREALPHQHLNLAATMISMVIHYKINPSYDPVLLAELEPFYLRPSQAEVIKMRKLKENK